MVHGGGHHHSGGGGGGGHSHHHHHHGGGGVRGFMTTSTPTTTTGANTIRHGHGGGHHHHNHHHHRDNESNNGGGSRSSWFQRQHQDRFHWNNQSTVVVVQETTNNNNGSGYPWWGNMYPRRASNRQQQQQQQQQQQRAYSSSTMLYEREEDCFDRCCKACFTLLCESICAVCCCCCAWSFCCSGAAPTAARREDHQPLQQRRASRNARRYSTSSSSSNVDDSPIHISRFLCPGLFLSILLFLILFSTSSMDHYWTLNVGETRRVHVPLLMESVDLWAASATGNTNAVVYSFAECPSLTGPTVDMKQDQALDLGGGDYQYDYYYLNAGSTIEVDFHQHQGATNVYLIRGEQALQGLEEGTYDDPEEWENDAIATRFVSGDSTARFKYRARHSDVYIVVYDNDSEYRTGAMDVHTEVVLTTYNLAGHNPVCTSLLDGSVCVMKDPKRRACLLVQATTTDDKKDGFGHNPAPPLEQGPPPPPPPPHAMGFTEETIISIEVHGQRKWLPLALWSWAPLMLSFVLAAMYYLFHHCSTCSNNRNNRTNSNGSIRNEYEPILDSHDEEEEDDEPDERPPPTAPYADASLEPDGGDSSPLPPAMVPPSAPVMEEEEEIHTREPVTAQQVSVVMGVEHDAAASNVPLIPAENVTVVGPTEGATK